MRRREFIALLSGVATAWPLATRAQQATKIRQIGILSLGRGDRSDASLTTLDAFVPALRELGYTEGQNIAFDRKFADGDANKLSRLAQELVDSRVDVIVVFATPAARAVKQVTSSIPIIAIAMADPVEDELVTSLARPGGNVTGTAFLGPELVSRRLQLLKEIVPRLSRVVVLWHPRAYGERTMASMLKEIESAAQSLGTRLQLVPAAGPDDLDNAFSAMTTERADGLIVFPSPMLFSQYSRIVTFAANNRLPAMYAAREGVELGGLASYGVNLPDLSRATAIYLDKILKGAKPAELPVQQPTKFELVINLKTATALGLAIPSGVMAIADEVIGIGHYLLRCKRPLLPLGFGRVDHARRAEQIERVHRPDQPRQHPGGAVLGNKPALGEGRGQFGALRHVAKIAKQDEAEGDAGDRTVDGGEDRLRHREQVAELLLEVTQLASIGADDGARRFARR